MTTNQPPHSRQTGSIAIVLGLVVVLILAVAGWFLASGSGAATGAASASKVAVSQLVSKTDTLTSSAQTQIADGTAPASVTLSLADTLLPKSLLIDTSNLPPATTAPITGWKWADDLGGQWTTCGLPAVLSVNTPAEFIAAAVPLFNACVAALSQPGTPDGTLDSLSSVSVLSSNGTTGTVEAMARDGWWAGWNYYNIQKSSSCPAGYTLSGATCVSSSPAAVPSGSLVKASSVLGTGQTAYMFYGAGLTSAACKLVNEKASGSASIPSVSLTDTQLMADGSNISAASAAINSGTRYGCVATSSGLNVFFAQYAIQ